MCLEVFGGVVAQVDCFGAVVGVLVGCCAPDAERGVCTGYNGDFVLYSAVMAWMLDWLFLFLSSPSLNAIF